MLRGCCTKGPRGKSQCPVVSSRVTTGGRESNKRTPQGGAKWKDVVGCTTVNSNAAEVLDCISIDPKKKQIYRTVIKGTPIPTSGPPKACEHVKSLRSWDRRA